MIAQLFETRLQIRRQSTEAAKLSLSLSIAPDAFSYCLSEQRFQQPTELLAVTAQVNEAEAPAVEAFEFFISNNRLLNQPFEKIMISVLSSDFTLLPAAFSTDADTQVLDFVNGSTNKKQLVHHLHGMDLLAGIDQELMASLERHFPGAAIRHSGAVSINLFFSQHSLTSADLFLNIVGNQMELMARKNSQLLFYNIFKHQSEEDILYYLLFAMEQFGFEPSRTQLAVAGDRMAIDPLFTSISRYVRHLSFCAQDASLSLKGEFAKLPSHAYFHLLNQHLCE
jgi:hypothetical protein